MVKMVILAFVFIKMTKEMQVMRALLMMTGKLCQVPLFRLNSVLKQPGRRDEEDEEPERQQWDK